MFTMEKYLKDDIVPRKLRWDVPLNDGLIGEDDIQEWYMFFNNTGKEVMEFLIKPKQRKMKMVEGQIKEFREKIEPFKTTAEYAKQMGILQKMCKKKDLENENVKKKKYLRDIGNYQKKRVFRWQANMEVGVVVTDQIPLLNKEIKWEIKVWDLKHCRLPSNIFNISSLPHKRGNNPQYIIQREDWITLMDHNTRLENPIMTIKVLMGMEVGPHTKDTHQPR